MKHFKKGLSIFLMAVVVLGTMIPVFGANAQMRPDTGNLIIHRYDYDHSYTPGTPNHGEEVTITGATPLKDIVFNIYTVPTTTSYPSEGTVTVDKISNTTKFTDSEGKVFNVTFKTSVTTNASGTATVSNLPKGVYLVVEQTNLNVSTQSYPYIVSVPMTEEDGDGWLTNVHSYPKNGKSIAIEKTLKSEPDVSIGDVATWEIKALTGDAVKESKQYIIKDNSITNLSSTVLAYTDTVSIKDDKGNVVPASNYSVGYDETTKELWITFNAAGRNYIADFDYIVATIKTKVNSNILNASDRTTTNNVTLYFQNRFDDVHTYNDSATVHTAAIKVTKTNQKSEKLSGAKFQIASSEANAQEGRYLKKTSAGDVVDYGETGYASANTWELTTNANGEVLFEGIDNTSGISSLTYKSYWLVETKAPTGYELFGRPIEAKFTNSVTQSSGYTLSISVNDEKIPILPKTGQDGNRIVYAVAFGILVLVIIICLVAYKKKNGKKKV